MTGPCAVCKVAVVERYGEFCRSTLCESCEEALRARYPTRRRT